MSTIYDYDVATIDGIETNLGTYQGKVMLIVNVASKCGFTSQYDGLEKLYKKYQDKGLAILGFPCNQFGKQEPGTEDQIMEFCRLNYGVTFPMFAKIEVNGDNAHPLYVHLKKQRPGILGSGSIKWNFTKFLIDREGRVIDRFSPSTTPGVLEKNLLSLFQAVDQEG
ncbi:MAG: glutathione peroxidase [Desulforhopalus sp.]